MKSMARRVILKALQRSGCTLHRSTGGHDVYLCPCLNHRAPLPRNTTISPGVVRSIQDAMACLPKGWLQ